MRNPASVTASVLLLSVVLPVLVVQAQQLGADGFPVDYQPGDFQVDPAAAVVSVTATASASDVISPTGTRYRVEDLPRAGRSLVASETRAPSVTSLPQPTGIVNAGKAPETLAEVAAWGPLTPINGGAADDAWRGVSRQQVELLLGKVVRASALKTAQRAVLDGFVERLLLSTAMPPVGDGANWLQVRAGFLERMGLDESAWQLWQGVPAKVRAQDEALALGWAERALLAGDVAGACTETRRWAGKGIEGQTRQVPAGAWPVTMTVCQLLEVSMPAAARGTQDTKTGLDSARLSWQLALENGYAITDPLLQTLVETWLQPGGVKDGALRRAAEALTLKGQVSPLAAALLVAKPALLNVAPGLTGKLPLVALRRLTNSPQLPLPLRTRAAEVLADRSAGSVMGRVVGGTGSAEIAGTADGRALAQLYDAARFDAGAMQDPIGRARALGDGVQARALLWQAARGQTGVDGAADAPDSEKAPLSLRALSWNRWQDRARQDGLAHLAVQLPPMQAGLRPDPTLIWLTPQLVKLAWQAGGMSRDVLPETQQVKPWLAAGAGWEVSRSTAGEQAAFGRNLRMQNALLAGEVPDEQVWKAWVQGLSPRPGAEQGGPALSDAGKTLTVAQQLLPAAGGQVPAEIWADMIGKIAPAAGADVAPDAVWSGALQAAAANGQTGLVTLLLAQNSGSGEGRGQAAVQARLAALAAVRDVRNMRALAAAFLADSLGETAVQMAQDSVLAVPAPPTMNGGVVPPVRGREIGGGRADMVAKGVAETGPAVDDDLILPPPRVQAAKPRSGAGRTGGKPAGFRRLSGPAAPQRPVVSPVEIDGLEPAAGGETKQNMPRNLPFSLFREGTR